MINPMDLSDRTILITGASSGIGRETAILLAQLGARVVLVGRNEERLKETAKSLDGNRSWIEPYDLTATDEIPSWVKGVVAKTGPLSGLVHSAGVQVTVPLKLLRNQHISEVMHINLNAAIALARGFRQKGMHSPHSSLVFLSSARGLVGQSGLSAYAASKGAVIALTKSLAVELAREQIRVNCVAPAYVKTEMIDKMQAQMTPEEFRRIEEMHPLGLGTALDVAYAIAFLLANTGRWITGTTLVVDGGYTAH